MSPQHNSPTSAVARPVILGKGWLGILMIAGILAFALAVSGLKAAQSGPSDVLRWTAAATKSQPAATKAATKSVMIMNYTYSPAALTVAVGDTVTWTNMDTAPHTVTVTSGPVKFKSKTLQKGDTFSYTFTTPGTYQYYCAVHPDMKASVTATGSATPAPTPTPTPTPTPEPTPGPTPTPTPAPTPPHPMPTPSPECMGLQAAVDAFMQHFYAAHLEASLGQQVADALAADQYVKTHTVLVGNMLQPLLGGTTSAVDTFMEHLYAAHLETSLGQQVADATALNQYVKTHTVLIENMISPLGGADLSSC